jgi:hypothetical protein
MARDIGWWSFPDETDQNNYQYHRPIVARLGFWFDARIAADAVETAM